LRKKRGAEGSRSALEGAGADAGVEKWRQDDVLVDERRHVAGGGVVRLLGRSFGDSGGVVARDDPGVNLEKLVGTLACEGLGRRR
jgi:hypothetical protein